LTPNPMPIHTTHAVDAKSTMPHMRLMLQTQFHSPHKALMQGGKGQEQREGAAASGALAAVERTASMILAGVQVMRKGRETGGWGHRGVREGAGMRACMQIHKHMRAHTYAHTHTHTHAHTHTHTHAHTHMHTHTHTHTHTPDIPTAWAPPPHKTMDETSGNRACNVCRVTCVV